MKIEKAIEILHNLDKGCSTVFADDLKGTKVGIKLGIEALKVIEQLRIHPGTFPLPLLPGETI